MGCSFGCLYTVTIFGESHSAGIGAVIGGIPAGTRLDLAAITESMQRRAPSGAVSSTARREKDGFEILSGFLDGHTTGTPLAVLIRNRDTKSEDYMRTAHLLRPGHADYTGYVKYKGHGDIRGGGHFSGRITAPLVFAGAVARQLLAQYGITVGAHIARIGSIEDEPYNRFDREELISPELRAAPLLNPAVEEQINEQILNAKHSKDSVGGVIECAAAGLPAGLGEPFFDSVESIMAHMMFAIPGVKAIEFGDGFAMAGMTGSTANDSPRVENNTITFTSNHSGGVNGGITNGMPLVFRVAVRPTPSIAQAQDTVNIKDRTNDVLCLHGRHDACIVPRAVEVVKCSAAVVLLDLLLQERAYRNG